MSTTRFSCRLCMIKSHTVVFPEAVPPATPMRNGSLPPPHRSTRSSTNEAYASVSKISPFSPRTRRPLPTEQFRSSICAKYESRSAVSAPGEPPGGVVTPMGERPGEPTV